MTRSRRVWSSTSGQGYYAVGSALRWPGCQVYAWEAEERSRQELEANRVRNTVQRRVYVRGVCGEEAFHEALGAHPPDLVIMDVEGQEAVLCSKRCIRRARQAFWVVECHQETIVQTLQKRFSPTHEVVTVENQPRTARDFTAPLPWYCVLLRYDRWRLVHEGCPFPTPWLVAKPR